jgi:hypothetical protein
VFSYLGDVRQKLDLEARAELRTLMDCFNEHLNERGQRLAALAGILFGECEPRGTQDSALHAVP